jgi:two-component system, cell cycle sensor histidine kinase and response regulator CckA
MVIPSEEYLHRMYERSPVGFYRSTFDGQFVFANPALVRMLRYQRVEEVMRLRLAEDVYFDPRDRARMIEKYGQTGMLDGIKVRWRTRDAQPLVVQLYGYLLRESNCIDATVIDVTQLDEAQTRIELQREELERSSTTLRLLWQQLPGLVWTVDRELRITSGDGAAIAQFKDKVAGNLGQTLFQFFATDQLDYLPIRRHREALQGRWVGYHQEIDGKQFAVTLAPHRADNGAIIGVIGVGVDVTTRHRLEQRMVDAQRAESLGVLAGGLAHDFNNLLVAVLGNVELGLRDTSVSAPGYQVLENIRVATIDAVALTTQLLAYAGREQLHPVDIELAPILEDVLRIAAPQIPDTIRLIVDVPLELPPILGDAAQLRQVVLNLITNARDALVDRRGVIAVYASVIEVDGAWSEHYFLSPPSGRFVALDVIDDGPGMNAATMPRIFDPFFSTKPHGHGLGLASVLGIVRSHGGGISVHSSPGHGATVRVLWPIHAGSEIKARARGTPPTPSPAVQPIYASTILVVDDEDAVRDVLMRLIEDLGYSVIAVADGWQALQVIDKETEIDAVVVDLTMPGMSGTTLVHEIRQRRAQLPIVVCTGAEPGGMEMPPVEGFLSKPFRIDTLEELLATLVGRPEHEPAL